MVVKELTSWIEAGSILSIAIITAISVSALTLYRLDDLEDKVDKLVETTTSIRLIEKDVAELKRHDKNILNLFGKLAVSIDNLTVAVAKLEVKQELQEK